MISSHSNRDRRDQRRGAEGAGRRQGEPSPSRGVSQLTAGHGPRSTRASLSRGAGVEISGLIGFPTLRQLVISIDYRDNLVHVVYDPKKGYHINSKISDEF